MKKVTHILQQMQFAHQFAQYTLRTTDWDTWKITPDGLRTNINWLVGHMLYSKYFHTLESTFAEPTYAVPISDYKNWYSRETNPADNLRAKPTAPTLVADLDKLHDEVVARITPLDDKALLTPVRTLHPVANTWEEALNFAHAHEMYHVGQVALLNRTIKQ